MHNVVILECINFIKFHIYVTASAVAFYDLACTVVTISVACIVIGI